MRFRNDDKRAVISAAAAIRFICGLLAVPVDAVKKKRRRQLPKETAAQVHRLRKRYATTFCMTVTV